MTTMNTQVRLILYDRDGNQVQLTTSCYQDGINVEIHGRPGVTTFNSTHFADVIAALVVGVEHIDGLPGYCQCEDCRGKRGKALAERIAEAQVERLRRADEGRK
jgi:hypothetical protein